jgi:hypothetical protein
MAYRRGGQTAVGRDAGRWAASLAAPPLVPARPDEQSGAPARLAHPRVAELDCLRGHLPTSTLAQCERHATAIGVGADRVLIAAGAIAEDDYVAAFANWHGIPFEPLIHRPRAACPVSDAR